MNHTYAILCNAHAWGGLELFMCKWCLWLHESGYKAIIYAPAGSKAVAYAQEKQLPYQTFATQRKYADFKAARKLQKSFYTHGITHCFIGHSKDIGLLSLMKMLGWFEGKTIYFQQMQIGVSKKDWLHRLLYRYLDYWITPLPWLKQNTMERAGIATHKIHVIPFGIDISRFEKAPAEKAILRKALQIPLDGELIGCIGRLDPAKGQIYLLEALSILHALDIKSRVLIVGDTSYQEHAQYPDVLKKKCQELKIADYVHFMPFRQDVENIYYALDLYVMPSVNETYGYVTLEAMACGLPVVGANAGGTAQIIDHGQTGLLFENKNATDLAEKLMQLITQPTLRKNLSALAKAHVTERYCHHTMVAQVIRLITATEPTEN